MLEWLVDNSFTFYILLALVAIGLAAWWWHTRQRPVLIALGVTGGMMLLVWLLTLLVTTDQMRLQSIVEELATGINTNQPERIVKHLATDFRFQTLTKDDAQVRIGRALQHYQLREATTWKYEVEKLDRTARTARLSFLTRVEVNGTAHPFRCRGDFVLEGDRWRLKGIEIFLPNTEQPLPVRLP